LILDAAPSHNIRTAAAHAAAVLFKEPFLNFGFDFFT
jgi:hypothetical protein